MSLKNESYPFKTTLYNPFKIINKIAKYGPNIMYINIINNINSYMFLFFKLRIIKQLGKNRNEFNIKSIYK